MSNPGVGTEKIHKGTTVQNLCDIWKVFGESFPCNTKKEKHRETKKPRGNKTKPKIKDNNYTTLS